jgi:outer membrane protein assembly factor BamA
MIIARVQKLILGLILVTLTSAIWAQEEGIISDISLIGLKKSKPDYIFRFLSSRVGTSFEPDLVDRDVQILKNLYTIADARAEIDSTEGIKITFYLDEALTLFPILALGGIQDNVWFQVGFKDIHFLGQGIDFSAIYGNTDSRHNIYLYYRIPYLKGSRWGIATNLVRWASSEPLYFPEGVVSYDYDNYLAGLTGSYEINYNHYLEMGMALFYEKYTKLSDQVLENPPGPESLHQNKSLWKIRHVIDRKNYHSYRLEGLDNEVSFETVYTFTDQSWFHLFTNTTRLFKKVSSFGNLAGRLRFGLSTNNDTPFAPFVLDSRVNIRGSGNRIDRGTGQIILNLEYRQTLIDYGPVAGQCIVFSDMGTWRNPGGGFSDFVDSDNFRHFVGGGLRLIYKKAYNAIISVDYGIDIYDTSHRGFVFSIGQYF